VITICFIHTIATYKDLTSLLHGWNLPGMNTDFA